HTAGEKTRIVSSLARSPYAPSAQLGNGRRGDIRNAVTRSRTQLRRSMTFFTSRSSASQSWQYQSGGISPAAAQMLSSSMFSTRESQGSNESQPRMAAYTSFLAYTPRSGLSGNVHSPALKQYP